MSDTWKDEARKKQQKNFTLLGNRIWDKVGPGEWKILHLKVGFALYDAPDELPSEGNKSTGYSVPKLKRIEELCEKLTQPFDFDENGILFACVFIIGKVGGQSITFPVFKSESLGSTPGTCLFVDARARVYNAWNEFLHDETLAPGTYCAPFDGFYAVGEDNQVALSFHQSEPRDNRLETDSVSDDRLTDWALRIMKYGINQDSENLARSELRSLDVYQFIVEFLFCNNVLPDFGYAHEIIKQVQKDTLDQYRGQMPPEARAKFDTRTEAFRGSDSLRGNTQVIMTLSKMPDVKELFTLLAHKSVDSSQVELVPYERKHRGIRGQLMVQEDLEIHPLKLLEIDEEWREFIYESSNGYHIAMMEIEERRGRGEIDDDEESEEKSIARDAYHEKMEEVCRTFRIKFESMHKKTMETLCEYCGKSSENEIEIGGHRIFANLSGHEKTRLGAILDRTLENDEELLNIALEYAEFRGCETFLDFEAHAEFLAEGISELKKLKRAELNKEQIESGMKLEDFLREKKIPRSWKDEIKHRARGDFKGDGKPEAFRKLGREFDELEVIVGPRNRASRTNGFQTDKLAVYHFKKHGDKLSPDDFYTLLEEICDQEPTRRILSQDGTCTLIHFENAEKKVNVIKIDAYTEDEWTTGLVTILPLKGKR